jgi:hypothetical protein
MRSILLISLIYLSVASAKHHVCRIRKSAYTLGTSPSPSGYVQAAADRPSASPSSVQAVQSQTQAIQPVTTTNTTSALNQPQSQMASAGNATSEIALAGQMQYVLSGYDMVVSNGVTRISSYVSTIGSPTTASRTSTVSATTTSKVSTSTSPKPTTTPAGNAAAFRKCMEMLVNPFLAGNLTSSRVLEAVKCMEPMLSDPKSLNVSESTIKAAQKLKEECDKKGEDILKDPDTLLLSYLVHLAKECHGVSDGKLRDPRTIKTLVPDKKFQKSCKATEKLLRAYGIQHGRKNVTMQLDCDNPLNAVGLTLSVAILNTPKSFFNLIQFNYLVDALQSIVTGISITLEGVVRACAWVCEVPLIIMEVALQPLAIVFHGTPLDPTRIVQVLRKLPYNLASDVLSMVTGSLIQILDVLRVDQ